jgi:hypothetical protein
MLEKKKKFLKKNKKLNKLKAVDSRIKDIIN